MSPASISFEDFTLPFMKETECDDELVDEDEVDPRELLKKMKASVPDDAIYLGSVKAEAYNWTSWQTKDKYYLIPVSGDGFEWALFRISWDDNWGRYEWSADARGSGFADAQDAARAIAEALFKNWGLDLTNRDNRSYIKFLKKLQPSES